MQFEWLRNFKFTPRMRKVLIYLGVLFGGIFLYKTFVAIMIHHSIANKKQIVTVSTTKVGASLWNRTLSASGSLRAIRGVNVTTELAGMVQSIYFKPGDYVNAGTILVQLNADTEIGQLQSLQAQAELAKITYERDKKQYAIHAISKQILDSDFQNLRNLQGQVAAQEGTVNKKSIKAPFAGRLGINNVNLGQYINTGDLIVTLQALDPIWVDFYVPQQSLSQLKLGQPVTIIADTFPDKKFSGKITTINPAIDVNTRNVLVEATIPNPQYQLTPGMFAAVAVETGAPQRYLTLPQTVVTFNPYGNVVYLIKKNKDGELISKQVFVITGDTRGDQVAILKGLKEGDTVVSSGQLKLKNGSQVEINNSIVPENNPAPQLSNDH